MRYFALSFALALGLAALINYAVDPAHLFEGEEGSYEKGIAAILLSGKNAANVSNFNDRLLQKFYIDGLSAPPDAIVLGSSRSMQIRAGLSPGGSFFNHSVTAASLQDFMAVYELYRRRNLFPKDVYLVLDPWILNRFNNRTGWRTLAPEFASLSKDLHLSPDLQPMPRSGTINASRYIELISMAYFMKSLADLRTRGLSAKHRGYWPTAETASDVPIKKRDGSFSYDRPHREITRDRAAALAVQFTQGQPVYALGKFSRLDPALSYALEIFLRRLRDDGAKITLILLPYHPLSYRSLLSSSDYRIMGEAERYYLDMSQRLNVPIYGSYDPAVSGCDEADFYDGMHPRETCVDKVFLQFR